MRKIAWGRVIPAALLLLMILTAVFFTGWLLGRTGDRPETAPSETVSAPSAPSSETPSEPEPEPEPLETASGVMADGTMHTLVLETPDGQEIIFDRSEAEVVDNGCGLLIGASLTVAYRPAEGENALPAAVSITVDAPPPESSAEERAEEILSGMTLEEKVGQMFIARCPEEGAAEKAARYHLGGYILFARDFEGRTPAEASAAIASYQAASDIPLLIGVDEEGGAVNRVSRFPAYRDAPFPSPQALYQAGGFEAVEADTEEKCALLSSLGVNVNFAPVCDLPDSPDDFIYDRSFGTDASLTARYVRTVVGTMRGTGVLSVLKHFPGYGNNADTHTGIACDTRPYKDFLAEDFLPFEAGIEAGAEMALVSHNIVSCIDPDRPASLSPAVHTVLRETLGFTGVIVTDDLAMDGVRDFTGDAEAAVLAVEAGNDLLCCTDFETQIPAVVDAVRSGRLSEEQVDAAAGRVLAMKIDAGIIA